MAGASLVAAFLVVLVAASLVPVVEVPPLVAGGSLVAAFLVVLVVPPWFQWWRCLPGGCLPGGAGGASLVPVVEVPPLVAGVLVAGGCLPGGAGGASLVPRPHIHSRTRGRGHARLLSAAALSLVNRSCKESLLDAIALIINYLGFPFGMAFTGWLFC